MTWNYSTWIGCSVAISVGIFLITLTVLLILLMENNSVFYAVVSQLLNIERCFIDVHHNIIRKNEKFNFSTDIIQNYLFTLGSQGAISPLVSAGASPNAPGSEEARDGQSKDEKSVKDHSSVPSTPYGIVANDNGNGNRTSTETKQEISPKPESHPEHEREVLNLYGRYMSVHKKGTLFFVMALTTIIISGALIAACNSLVLATSSVYRDGPCPPIGPTECFCGGNHTYFTCDTGRTAVFPLDTHSGACFRWIARDTTTSDVTTQLGITTGLLVAFGSIAQAIIRMYLLAFNKRLGIATGIHRIAAKTIGINRDTARTRFCCCNLPWHCSVCNLSLFKHPAAVIIVTVIYIAAPFLMVPGVILLYYYELSVTSLTFVILIVVGMVCVLSIVWIMVQESEASSNIPGGWMDAKKLLQSAVREANKMTNGQGSQVPNVPGAHK